MTLGNILFLLVIGVVIYRMMKGGGGCCGGHDHGGNNDHGGHADSGNGKGTGHPHNHMIIETSENGMEKDPVCGMETNHNSIASNHLGRTFHFCSDQCRKVFDLNPNKYAGA